MVCDYETDFGIVLRNLQVNLPDLPEDLNQFWYLVEFRQGKGCRYNNFSPRLLRAVYRGNEIFLPIPKPWLIRRFLEMGPVWQFRLIGERCNRGFFLSIGNFL